MIFIKILLRILKQDLTLGIMNQTDHCLKGKKGSWIKKDELRRKITKEFVGLIAKIYSYLTDDSEDEESKYTKLCAIKRKLKFEEYQICSESTKLKSNINHIEKTKLM